MALPLYKCLNCSRRNDDPSLPIRCLKGRVHQWDKILGDGPQRLDTLIVCDATIDFQGGKAHCLLPENHYEDHKFFEEQVNEVKIDGKQIFPGGAAASKIAGFKYIPLCALERLAKRFELGLERHGKNSWNALNPQSATMLDDREWLIERLSHVIHHCYKEIEYLASGKKAPEDARDDNAAAIMWGGACLIAASERRKEYDNVRAASQNTTEKRDS